VPEIQALIEDPAVEKYPREEAQQLIEEARELCDQGETEEALYKLSLAKEVLEDSAIEDPTSEDPSTD
jgi:hypothetical protein